MPRFPALELFVFVTTNRITGLFEALESLNILNPVNDTRKLVEMITDEMPMKYLDALWKKLCNVLQRLD